MPALNDIFADKFLAVAHRGYSTATPENTMASFERAVETGIGLIEFDVQLTRDRVPVVIHDPEVDRTTNGRGRIRDYSLSEITQLDAGSWFGPEFSDQRVPILAGVLDWARDRVCLVIELKNNGSTPEEMDELVDATLDTIDQADISGQVALISFDHRSISRVENSGIGIVTGCLIMPHPYRIKHSAGRLMRIARETGSSLILPFYQSIGRRLVQKLAREELRIVTWTIDSEADILKQIDLGVAGMSSNDPRLLASTLRSAGVKF